MKFICRRAAIPQAFLDGAYFVYGHTAMQRLRGMGFQSEWAKDQLPVRKERNVFYTQIGRALPPGVEGAGKAALVSTEHRPHDVLRLLGVGI